MAGPAELWRMVAEERVGLADTLDGLTDEQWATPSLCEGWTVRDVAAHLVPRERSMARLLVKLAVSYRLDFARFAFDMAKQDPTPGPLLARELREEKDSRFVPPGMGPIAPLTDLVVHGQDVRRPLGIDHRITPDRARPILDFLVSPKATRGFVRKSHVTGITWRCTDLEWSSGSGPLVQGPAADIILALLGREVAYKELAGDGVALLTSR